MNRYPCPDCEDALGPCSGLGCPAKGMERPPFRSARPCRVPKVKPPSENCRARFMNATEPRICDRCGREYQGRKKQRWCGIECKRAARKVRDAAKYAARKATA